MARKALFATDDQPVRQSEGDELAKKADQEGGDSAVSPLDADVAAVTSVPKKRLEVVAQTQEQRLAALGIEDGLLTALKEKEDADSIDKWLREQAVCCGELTLQRLTQAGHISGGEAQSILESYGYYVDDVRKGKNILDILAFHVWVKLDTKDKRAEKEIRNLTEQLASIVPTGVTHCNFPRLNDSSLEVYEKFPIVEKVCATLMCPVIQVNERDFVSVASVNPVTAATVGVLLEQIMEREGVRPFTFVLTMNANAWTELCEKQFDIEV